MSFPLNHSGSKGNYTLKFYETTILKALVLPVRSLMLLFIIFSLEVPPSYMVSKSRVRGVITPWLWIKIMVMIVKIISSIRIIQ